MWSQADFEVKRKYQSEDADEDGSSDEEVQRDDKTAYRPRKTARKNRNQTRMDTDDENPESSRDTQPSLDTAASHRSPQDPRRTSNFIWKHNPQLRHEELSQDQDIDLYRKNLESTLGLLQTMCNTAERSSVSQNTNKTQQQLEAAFATDHLILLHADMIINSLNSFAKIFPRVAHEKRSEIEGLLVYVEQKKIPVRNRAYRTGFVLLETWNEADARLRLDPEPSLGIDAQLAIESKIPSRRKTNVQIIPVNSVPRWMNEEVYKKIGSYKNIVLGKDNEDNPMAGTIVFLFYKSESKAVFTKQDIARIRVALAEKSGALGILLYASLPVIQASSPENINLVLDAGVTEVFRLDIATEENYPSKIYFPKQLQRHLDALESVAPKIDETALIFDDRISFGRKK